jgi:hypothetical protein
MTVWLTLIAVLAIIGLRVTVLSIWRRRFAALERRQKLRERFAATRRDAVRLVSEGQLKPDSVSFGALYSLSSVLVRRSHNYDHFSNEVIRGLAKGGFSDDSPVLKGLEAEQHSWTPDVKEAYLTFSRSLFDMVLRHSPIVRLVIIVDRLGFGNAVVSLAEAAHRLRARRNLKVLRAAQATMKWASIA